MANRTNTRERLIAEAMNMLEEGPSSHITTRTLTQRVGIRQPTFYSHFQGIDEIVAIAAERMGEELVAFLVDSQKRLRRMGSVSADAIAVHAGEILQDVLHRSVPMRVYMMHRRQPGPIGDAMRRLEYGASQAIQMHFYAQLRTVGLNPNDLAEPIQHASFLIVGTFRNIVELLLDKHIEDTALLSRIFALQIINISKTILGNPLKPSQDPSAEDSSS